MDIRGVFKMEIFLSKQNKCLSFTNEEIAQMINKNGINKTINYILNIITSQNISYPYKKLFLEINIENLINNIKDVVFNTSNWSHEPYNISDQKIVTCNMSYPIEYSILFSKPYLENDILQFEDPKYYLFNYKIFLIK